MNRWHISPQEARSTLESLTNAQQKVISSVRPPVWLILGSAALFGFLTLSFSLQADSRQWTLATYGSALAFVASYGFWLWRTRVMGTGVRVVPNGIGSMIFYVAQAIFFSITIFGSNALYENGTAWAPYAAAVVNTVVIAFLIYKYPTTDLAHKAD